LSDFVLSALRRTLVWVGRDGNEEPIEAEADGYYHPRISPDGTQIASSITNGQTADIWIWHLVRKTKTRLTFNTADDLMPLWTPDGKRIAFYSQRETGMGAYWKAADGTGKTEPISPLSGAIQAQIPSSWADNGKTMVIADITADSLSGISLNIIPFDIAALSMEGDEDRRLLLHEKYSEVQPRVSPDGSWLAYTSDESGRNQIYVRPFPDVEEGRWQISTDGGDSPLWAPDGGELFYRSADAVMAVSVETEPAFSFETPVTLFQGEYVGASFALLRFEMNPWDISPDGKRFLMMKGNQISTTETISPRRINIILNWFEELKDRVPTD